MRFVDEFREPELIARTADEIRRLADPGRHYRLMEVCGGHTHSIYRFGLKDVLPSNIELVHGPGCPVCVTALETIDRAHAIASRPDVTFCSFGYMLRVPGSRGDLLELKDLRRSVFGVYHRFHVLTSASCFSAWPTLCGCEFTRREMNHFGADIPQLLGDSRISGLWCRLGYFAVNKVFSGNSLNLG